MSDHSAYSYQFEMYKSAINAVESKLIVDDAAAAGAAAAAADCCCHNLNYNNDLNLIEVCTWNNHPMMYDTLLYCYSSYCHSCR